jgi:hypothetical protein
MEYRKFFILTQPSQQTIMQRQWLMMITFLSSRAINWLAVEDLTEHGNRKRIKTLLFLWLNG